MVEYLVEGVFRNGLPEMMEGMLATFELKIMSLTAIATMILHHVCNTVPVKQDETVGVLRSFGPPNDWASQTWITSKLPK